MQKEYLVIGDIHGCFKEAHELIESVHKEEQLIFLGDYIDRGPQSKEVIAYVREKVAAGAVALKGNHDDMLIEFLKDPIDNASVYLPQGGSQTFASYDLKGFDAEFLQQSFLRQHKEDVDFIKNLPLYYETDEFIFVHAGVSPFVDDWHDSSPSDFLWLRGWFFNNKNKTGKTIVFGHTVTSFINKDKSNVVWFSPDRSMIGIDGGLVFGGLLHAFKIVVNDEGFSLFDYAIDKTLEIKYTEL